MKYVADGGIKKASELGEIRKLEILVIIMNRLKNILHFIT